MSIFFAPAKTIVPTGRMAPEFAFMRLFLSPMVLGISSASNPASSPPDLTIGVPAMESPSGMAILALAAPVVPAGSHLATDGDAFVGLQMTSHASPPDWGVKALSAKEIGSTLPKTSMKATPSRVATEMSPSGRLVPLSFPIRKPELATMTAIGAATYSLPSWDTATPSHLRELPPMETTACTTFAPSAYPAVFPRSHLSKKTSILPAAARSANLPVPLHLAQTLESTLDFLFPLPPQVLQCADPLQSGHISTKKNPLPSR